MKRSLVTFAMIDDPIKQTDEPPSAAVLSQTRQWAEGTIASRLLVSADHVTPDETMRTLREAALQPRVGEHDPIADVRKIVAASGGPEFPSTGEPITCSSCGAQHSRGTVQGNQIPVGSVLLCHCDIPLRVGAGPFAEAIDMKTCTNTDFLLINKTRDAMKKARRDWKRQQAANRDAAARRRGR